MNHDHLKIPLLFRVTASHPNASQTSMITASKPPTNSLGIPIHLVSWKMGPVFTKQGEVALFDAITPPQSFHRPRTDASSIPVISGISLKIAPRPVRSDPIANIIELRIGLSDHFQTPITDTDEVSHHVVVANRYAEASLQVFAAYHFC